MERLFAEVTNKAIRRGSFHTVKELEKAIAEYLDAREAKPLIWTADSTANHPDLVALASRRGFEIVETFSENVSAMKTRPEFVLDLDRRGVHVVSYTEPWLDTGAPVRTDTSSRPTMPQPSAS